MRILLVHGGADPLKPTCHGWTPLHHAAFVGSSRVIRYLLDGSLIDSSLSQDSHGWTALHLAVHGRHLAIVDLLLHNPITSDSRLLRDENGLTPEEWLEHKVDSHTHRTISKLAFGKSRCCRAATTLRQAVQKGNVGLTEFLLEEGETYPIDETDSGNRTALYYAAKKDNIQILNMLLERGADPNILPVGRRTWEEFISSHIILQRLREAGYTKPIPDPEKDHQIKRIFALGKRVETIYSPSTTWAPPPRPEDAQRHQVDRSEGRREDKVEASSSIGKIWKRLRGK
ncbi:ankyrin repeat-containing domain protein [Hypoxylon sp. NC1633]|nr:ankyrin repeat-containing domain protein [Hypoxylon sp. NC1633]